MELFRYTALAILCGGLSISGACKEHGQAQSSKNEVPAKPTSPAKKQKPKRPTRPGPNPEATLRKQAEELLATWLATQNQGNYEAYQKLYSRSFVGIRRSGAQKVELDRKGWLADRKRMFKKPMRVSASDTTIHIEGNVAHLRFVQRWSSGTYEDIGPKRIRINTATKKIVAEEMLSSTITTNLNRASKALGLSLNIESISCEKIPSRPKRILCVADKSNGELHAEYTVALLNTDGAWTVLDKKSDQLEVAEQKYDATNTALVESELRRIGPDKYVIAVEIESESEGTWGPEVDDPGGHTRKTRLQWFAVEGDKLRSVLLLDSGGSSELEYSGEFDVLTVDIESNEQDAFFPITVERETSEWDGSKYSMDTPKQTTSKQALRWNSASRSYQ